MSEKFTFFWQELGQYGPFSQWHLGSPFEIDGIEYNCGEQYMMAEKARFFYDNAIAKKIMNETSPREIKKLGRNVANFDEEKWKEVAKEIVYKANYAKFSQNSDLKELLFATKNTTLVEASPYDKIYGIGLKEDNPLAQNRETWQGKNWLGEILTQVRDHLMKEHNERTK